MISTYIIFCAGFALACIHCLDEMRAELRETATGFRYPISLLIAFLMIMVAAPFMVFGPLIVLAWKKVTN